MSLSPLHPRPDSVLTTLPCLCSQADRCLFFVYCGYRAFLRDETPAGIQCKEVMPDTVCIKMTKMDATGPYLYTFVHECSHTHTNTYACYNNNQGTHSEGLQYQRAHLGCVLSVVCYVLRNKDRKISLADFFFILTPYNILTRLKTTKQKYHPWSICMLKVYLWWLIPSFCYHLD